MIVTLIEKMAGASIALRRTSMQIIEKDIIIQAPLEKVLEIMTDIERYPQIVPNIEKVNVLSFTPEDNKLHAEIHSYAAVLRKNIISVHEIVYDLENLSLKFQQTNGMIDDFRGHRQLVIEDDGVRFYSRVEFNLGNGFLAKMAGGMLKGVVEQNIEQLLGSVKTAAEQCELKVMTIDELRENLYQKLVFAA